MENGGAGEGKDPSSFLGDIIGNPVIVKLNSGVVYKGTERNHWHLSRPISWRIEALAGPAAAAANSDTC